MGSGDVPRGCFFVYTAVDPANRREPIHRRLADEQRAWLGFIEQLVGEAVHAGDLSLTADPKVLAFELDAIVIGADANFVLLGKRGFLDAGRVANRRRLAVSGSVLNAAITGTRRPADRNAAQGAVGLTIGRTMEPCCRPCPPSLR